MTALDLDPIRERLAAATPGPWDHNTAAELIQTEKGDTVVVPAWFGEDLPRWEGAEFIAHAPADVAALVAEVERLRENPRDEHHTMAELYDYRLAYNAAAFNEWADSGMHDVHKSLRHSDGGLCFGGGWFVVVAQLPTGQITNHYHLEHWDLFHVPERDQAAPYDGHTPAEALVRLLAFLGSPR